MKIMFGVYTNQRITNAESKILIDNPDDYLWYMMYVRTFFKDYRFFQIRQDIELPQSEDDNGVVLIFQGGNVVYFKTIDSDVDDKVISSIHKVCYFLEQKFNRPIDSYVVFPPDCEVKSWDIEKKGEIKIIFSTLRNDNGEEIIDRLMAKLKNHEEFNHKDSIDHMILPYNGFKDRKVFDEKFKNYMELINEYGADKEVEEC